MTSSLDELRAVAVRHEPSPSAMQPYLEKVRGRAFSVTDADVEALKAAGFSEDEIFEQTVSAAISEGLRRLDAASKVLDP